MDSIHSKNKIKETGLTSQRPTPDSISCQKYLEDWE